LRPFALLVIIMHAPVKRDRLLDQADAAIATNRQLRDQLSDAIAAARTQRRHARQVKAFQSGLSPAAAISLLVRRDYAD
jgi:hypothetical protein